MLFPAYPQAEVDGYICMKLPKGFELLGNHGKGKYCLKLFKNIYLLKQAGRVWNLHLHQGLLKFITHNPKLTLVYIIE